MSLITLICGGQGTGKTTFVKSCIVNPKRGIILDINNEYKEFDTLGAHRVTEKFRDSLENISALDGITLVVEEATVFFSNRKYDEKLCEMIVRKRHQKNDIFLIYHSLTDIPDYLLRLSDYLWLFKTKDNPTRIESKYKDMDEVKKGFYEVRKNKDVHYKYAIKLLQ
jgi:type IV secretory pathway VirB4 component